MFKKEAQKETLLFLRNSALKIMKIMVGKYEKTGDEDYLSHTKEWGIKSEEYNKEIKNL